MFQRRCSLSIWSPYFQIPKLGVREEEEEPNMITIRETVTMKMFPIMEGTASAFKFLRRARGMANTQ